MTSDRPVVALTSGEPAGIGPELCLKLAREALPARLVAIGDRALLQGFPHVEHVPLARTAVPGKLDAANGRYVLAVLDRAVRGCMAGEYAAMVTAPVQKSTINDAGIAFTGHTEYLAARAGTPQVVMMLVGGGLRVALATTHLPLREVPRAITKERVLDTLRVVDADLRKRFRIARPRILVAGLNPHSGESGHLGREEVEIIEPAIRAAVAAGIEASGPVPADTLFVPERLKGADCALARNASQSVRVLTKWNSRPGYRRPCSTNETFVSVHSTGSNQPSSKIRTSPAP